MYCHFSFLFVPTSVASGRLNDLHYLDTQATRASRYTVLLRKPADQLGWSPELSMGEQSEFRGSGGVVALLVSAGRVNPEPGRGEGKSECPKVNENVCFWAVLVARAMQMMLNSASLASQSAQETFYTGWKFGVEDRNGETARQEMHPTQRELARLTRCVHPVQGQKRRDLRKPESLFDRDSVRPTPGDM